MFKDRIDMYLKRAEEIVQNPEGIKTLEGAIENTERLLNNGEPVSQRNLIILKTTLQLVKQSQKAGQS